ncbi:hypothetical protein [Paenibacillus gansuensis]|uniref:Uncharacterized protein n=1 Tax=Paenibacillus gansuensis TaxID=306542 RepID=A0ABW5PKE4_9BACL
MIVQITGYVLVLAVWSFVRIRSLLRKQKIKVAAIYGLLMGTSTIIGSLLLAGVEVPSPDYPFQILFEPIGRMLLRE